MRFLKGLSKILLVLSISGLTGCSGNKQLYNQAFDSKHALTHNQCTFSQRPDNVFKIAKQILVQRGFTIENADAKTGIIKAVRNMQDENDSEISYNIHASADISEGAGGDETIVSLAASQQTILHRSVTTWWHLLWIIPIIPTGTDYQTLVIKEGNITEPAVYADYCNSLTVEVTKQNLAAKELAAKAAEKAAEKAAAESVAKAEAEAKAAAAKAEAEKAEAEAKAAAAKAEAEKNVNAEKIKEVKESISKDAEQSKELVQQIEAKPVKNQ